MHPFLWVLWEMFHGKKFEKRWIWSVLLYILILFCLKMFIAYLLMIDSAAWCLIASGLGAYIFRRENF